MSKVNKETQNKSFQKQFFPYLILCFTNAVQAWPLSTGRKPVFKSSFIAMNSKERTLESRRRGEPLNKVTGASSPTSLLKRMSELKNGIKSPSSKPYFDSYICPTFKICHRFLKMFLATIGKDFWYFPRHNKIFRDEKY